MIKGESYKSQTEEKYRKVERLMLVLCVNGSIHLSLSTFSDLKNITMLDRLPSKDNLLRDTISLRRLQGKCLVRNVGAI